MNIEKENLFFDQFYFFKKVLDNQICYHMKSAFELKKLFDFRYAMFKEVYCHNVGVSIEMMIADVLTLADDEMNIYEKTLVSNIYLSKLK